MEDLRNKLNKSQYEAVTTIEGPVLLIAGAGSGKTRAIEYRVLHMVRSGIPPQSILLLTFTRKAARQMLSRAASHESGCALVDGGTFHSFSFRMLKKYASRLGFSGSFSILDEGDAAEAVHKCASKIGVINNKDKRYPKKDTLRAIISMSINKASSIESIVEREYPHFTEFTGMIVKLKKDYALYKRENNYMDYDDLLVYMKALLDIEDARKEIAGRYRYIMVDEYQDTNLLQDNIVYLLAKDHTNILVVGDDAQSIYGFRGSSHKNIMRFPEKFDGCRVIKLEENYRSTQGILDLANAALMNMSDKYSKCLLSTRDDDGDRPGLIFFRNPYEEALFITNKIAENAGRGVELKDQAVLFRSAFVSIPLQAELARRGIKYELYGGMKFYETAHVKDILAHLKVLLNLKDEIAWTRLLMLIDGIGAKGAERIVKNIISKNSPEEIIDRALDIKGEKSAQGIFRLRAFLRSSLSFRLNPGVLYDMAYDHYLPLMRLKFDDWHVRMNDLETLRQSAAEYSSLEDLLADFAIEGPDKSGSRVPESRNTLTLSTIHSAKGLEWKSVFFIGLSDGVIPSNFALGSDEEIEEEARLFYVGLTRAKDELLLSMHHESTRNGMAYTNKVSRFLDERNILSALDQNILFEREDSFDLDDEDDFDPEHSSSRRRFVKYY